MARSMVLMVVVGMVLMLGRAVTMQECTIGSFTVDPESAMVMVGERHTLHCEFVTDDGQLVFRLWQWYRADGTNPSIGMDMPELNFLINGTNGDLIITNVMPFHAGMYACDVIPLSSNCNSENATITVEGPPEISDIETVDTESGQSVPINITVTGFPQPTITLYRLDNGVRSPVDSGRFQLTLDMASLTITVLNPIVADNGTYQVEARNDRGSTSKNFTFEVQGPDAPQVTINPSMVLSQFAVTISINCSVQSDAAGGGLQIEWWRNGNLVTALSGSVHTQMPESTVRQLTITSLTRELTGTYLCRTSNSRGNDEGSATVHGPPEQIDPITVMVEGNEVTIHWTPPTSQAPIVGYRVHITSQSTGSTQHEEQVSDSVMMASIELPDGSYFASVSALASLGETDEPVEGVLSEQMAFVINTTEPSPTDTPTPPTIGDDTISSSPSDSLIPIIGGVVAGIFVLIVIGGAIAIFFLCIYYPHRKQRTRQERNWDKEEEHDGRNGLVAAYGTLQLPPHSQLPPSPEFQNGSIFSSEIDPKWEFPRENIQLSEVLYEGPYTVLYKGTARGIKEKPMEVAIKTVKDDATEDDVKMMVYEMEQLSSIGYHPNIVSLLHVCTVGRPIYMVMEYMCHGDLLGFLRACRGHHSMYTISPGIGYHPPPLNLSSRDLLSIATKIADGMRYLADRKIVHRALCAKNVLVGTSMEIKIYNVGGFDMDNRDGLLKWMAPETLFDRTTTTYSDVWSFGVLLWELVTLGGTPYAEILPQDLYTQLHSGMRMPKPLHCAQEVYDIMHQCWEKNPTDRPHFAVIHERLDTLYTSKLSYLDLRNYNEMEYSQFDDLPQLSTAL